jgi:hypothetical protein
MRGMPGQIVAPGGASLPSSNSFAQKAGNGVERCLLLAILVCLALQFYQLFFLEINWDEFLYLSRIYDYQNQTLNRALQTFHVYFFNWLPWVGGNEIRQVEAGRIVMLLLETATTGFIYLLARSFTSRNAALIAALAYISAGFTMIHGASFRADPLAAFFIMGSLAILVRPQLKLGHYCVSALIMALAAMITVKVIFYAPALVALGLWQINRSDRPWQKLGCFLLTAGASALIFLGLYLWHEALLPAADLDGSQTMMASAAKTTILGLELLPTWNDLLIGASKALVPTILLVAGIGLAILSMGKRRADWVVPATILGLAAPLLSFLFYRNAYPYFFSFIFPPAMVLVSYAADRLGLTGRHMIVAAAIMVVSAAGTVFSLHDRDQDAQEQTVETVHKIFHDPVAVIDRNSMIASFPKRGIFMSSWGLQAYRQAGQPVYGTILSRETVPLLILNSPTLENAMGVPVSGPLKTQLFEADRRTLRTNYVHHWGKIWVGGKTLSVGEAPAEFEIAIPGRYTLEAGSPVSIDDRLISPGQAVALDRGTHVSVSKSAQNIVLRWSEAVYRPDFEPLDRTLYRGF